MLPSSTLRGMDAKMEANERLVALGRMQDASDAFYRSAVSIGNHPFIEFAGLMNQYITACRAAHREGRLHPVQCSQRADATAALSDVGLHQ